MKRRAAAKLPPEASGRELLEYLSSRFDYHTFAEWQKRIANGEIALDGKVCRECSTVLQSGSLLEYTPQNLVEPEVCRNYRIIFEDDQLMVIDKPGNLPVHPAGPYFNNTLWTMLKESNHTAIHFVNRLDRETSGLLIVGKSPAAAAELSSSLLDMQKCYNVLVHGEFPPQFTAKGFLYKDKNSPIRKKQRFSVKRPTDLSDEDKIFAVETDFTLLKKNEKFSLLAAELKTGRMHQIRATLCSLGYPVAGDKLYGLDEQFYRRLALDTLSESDRKKLVLPRQALHCCQLSFVHPTSKKVLEFHSPLPAELSALV